MMADSFSIRFATMADAPIITNHRRSMFQDMGERDTAKLNAMCASFDSWVVERLKSGEYLGWLVENENKQIVAGAGMWLLPWAPTPSDQSTHRGYVFNVYTQPDYRRRGLARRLMNAILDYCRKQNIHVVSLHASDEGRGLYESLGFKPTNELRLRLVE